MRTFVAFLLLCVTGAVHGQEVGVVEQTRAPYTLLGKVVGITDGDTITLLDPERQQHKIRLAGIDAPEKGQAFGQASKASLSDLVFDRLIQCHCGKIDKYGREVCWLEIDGSDANLEQIRRGMAWHYKAYEGEQTEEMRNAYAQVEITASSSKSCWGIDKDPMPPWVWRGLGRR